MKQRRVARVTGISQSQWRYYRHWLILVVATEALMLALHDSLFTIYLAVAALFFGGLLLRLLGLYPGEDEPPVLDALAVVIALFYASLSRWWVDSGLRFLLIMTSSAIIIPHFIYIHREK